MTWPAIVQSVVETLLTLHCKQCKSDPALFVCRRNGRFFGMIASHIGDFLYAGEGTFDPLVRSNLRQRFLAGKLDETNFRYVGLHIDQQ